MFISLTEYKTLNKITININKICYFQKEVADILPNKDAAICSKVFKTSVYLDNRRIPFFVEEDTATIDKTIQDVLSSNS